MGYRHWCDGGAVEQARPEIIAQIIAVIAAPCVEFLVTG
jgi:hypothetical protein